MVNYTLELMKSWIEEALLSLAHIDAILLERKVKEECINHRVARFLELTYSCIFHDEFPAMLEIDIEYNKNLNQEAKVLKYQDGGFRPIRPDIIIHNRNNNDSNLLAVEAKLGYLNQNDREKLDGLIKEPYNYSFSLGISYLPTKGYFNFILQDNQNHSIKFSLKKPISN